MKEILNNSLIFDQGQTFPLTDYCIDSQGYLDRLLQLDKETKDLLDQFYLPKIQQCFLKSLDRPLWFINNAVFEDQYQYLLTISLTAEEIEYFNSYGLDLYLSEPLNFYSSNFFQNNFLDYLTKFVENNKLNSLQVFVCEKNIQILNQYYPKIKLFSRDIFLTLTALEIADSNFVSQTPELLTDLILKKFWCGNVNYAQHRHYLLTYLVDKSGHYSWPHIKKHIEHSERYCALWVRNINSGNEFNNLLKNQHPKHYKTLTKNNKQVFNKPPNVMDGGNNSKAQSIAEYYNRCFCAVITETYFNSIYANISEKTLWAIAYGRPFILAAPQKSLEYLHELGFKTFNNFWDESYDQETDAGLRIIKIFELIDKINRLTLDQLRELYQQMIPTIKHNQTVLKNLPMTIRPML